MAAVTPIHLLKKHAFRITAGALVFWLLIGLLIYAAEMIAHHYFGARALDQIELRQYMLRWALWLLLTPLIVLLAARINIDSFRLHWFVLLHLLLGTVLLALEFGTEVLVIRPMAERYYQRTVLVRELMIPFLVKYFAYIINYFLIVGIVNMYIYMQSLQSTQKNLLRTRLQNKELEYRLALTQLQTLRMQIQPHFIFNAHHTISGLITLGNNEKAIQVLSALGGLLRRSLDQQQQGFVPLKEELVTVNLYMDIQQIRFSDRLQYHCRAGDDTAALRVPYFILQPLVENAMVHGVEQNDGPAILEIDARKDQGKLILSVTNTAAAMPATHKGMGVGISNVTGRLKQYFGDKAEFSLSHENGLTTARIKMPAHAS